MKNKILSSLAIFLLCAFLAFACAGCSTSGYSVQVGFDNNTEVSVKEEDIEQKERTITINGSAYDIKWTKRMKSSSTHKMFDIYELIDSPDEDMPGTIYLDCETGKLRCFYNMNPYPAIENMENLSDDELKAAVENMLGDLADFSEYNSFGIKRPTGIAGSSTDTSLSWRVVRELPCSISVNVIISEDGMIKQYSIFHDCPDDLSKSFLTEEERNKLIEKGVCKEMGIKELGNVTYEIETETLTCYHGKNALVYMVKITDEEGFPRLVVMTIS